MAHREIFVLTDAQGEDYHDYLNFGNRQSQGAAAVYSDGEYSKPARGRGKVHVRKTAAIRRPEPAFDMSIVDRMLKRSGLDGQFESTGNINEEEPTGNSKQAKIPSKQVAEHQQLLMCLQRYAASARFAPMLKDAGLKLTNLESKSVAELKQLQTRVRTVCSSSGGASGLLYHGIVTGAAVVEKMAPKRLVDLDGFTASLRADPEFEAVAEMLELDMGFAATMSPMQRMGVCLAKNAASVVHMNSQKNKMLTALLAQQQEMNIAQQRQQQPQSDPAHASHIEETPPAATAANLTVKATSEAQPRPVKDATPVYGD